MRRHIVHLVALAAVAAAATAPAHAAGSAATPSWAQAEIRTVVQRGLLAADVASFRPNDVLTEGDLAGLTAGLKGTPRARVANAGAPVTMTRLNGRLVSALGLHDAAVTLNTAARTGGLAPPARFGTEVVARLLGLRKNHPASQDALERLPSDPATRAEAAYSAAQILRLRETDLERVRATARSFVPPVLSQWQKKIVGAALRYVGFPYVWGGEFETPLSPFGPQAQGGFDCSGFVWRVFKLERYAGGESLADVLAGRTSMSMSGEVAPAKRLPLARVAAADVVFFGANGPRSKPAEVDHMGIALGNGWIVHSSSAGVALVPISGWYQERFAWARRPLAESGLELAPPLRSKL